MKSGPKPIPLRDRIVRNSEALSDGCWRWKGYLRRHDGYGDFKVGRRSYLAHRISYEAFIGAIPSGFQLDHLCRNRWCVNPWHLEPVTNRENCLRGRSPTILIYLSGHCGAGHEMKGENVYVRPDGGRDCRACNREAVRRYAARRHEQSVCP